jgi:hypothetical protein
LATEGSTAMRCRSLGMLACTVIAPLLAVFCVSSGEAGKQASGGGWATGPADSDVASSRAAAARPGSGGTQPGDLLRGRRLAPFTPSPVRVTAYETEATAIPPAPANAATGYGLPGDGAVLGAQPRAGVIDESQARGAAVRGRLVPVSGREGVSPAEDRLERVSEPPTAADHFTAIQQRLRRLGATYYRLETWGERGDQFRFQCRVASAEAPGSVRDFEAVDPEAVQAMAQVLWQAQTWCSAAGQN